MKKYAHQNGHAEAELWNSYRANPGAYHMRKNKAVTVSSSPLALLDSL
jgi:hypothetical protein